MNHHLERSPRHKRGFKWRNILNLSETKSVKYVQMASSSCNRHGLTSIALLWHRNQQELLNEMINYKIDAILIKVASYGLKKNHLGRSIKNLQP